jgi:hypothetical protein
MAAGGSALATGGQAPEVQAAAPKTILMDGRFLEGVRRQGDPEILRAARAEADKAMKAPLLSIMSEKAMPPSGDKHDYMSLAPYWWPNPATPNHLPYVRKDGVHNPEASAVADHALLSHMEANVHALALGYFLTGDQRYAARAVEQLRAWFLNPATRMNPNLQYAQAIRGVNQGRGTGILDAQGLSDVVDALGLLAGSPSWTSSDDAAMHAWFETYFNWLTTSANGKAEAAAKNNHGSWYDAQAVGIALYLGKAEFARNVAEAAKTKHIAVQIQPDGDQPLEDVRTRSFHYSIYNLEALMKLATEAQTVNVDLWSYKAPDGGSIRGVVDYLLPFADGKKKWEHQELDGVSLAPLRDPLLIAAVHYNDARYEDAGLAEQNHDARTLLLEREFAATQKAGR